MAPYSEVMPKVMCPCGGRMLPTCRADYPYEFRCNRCVDANVDILPPEQGWEPRRCGSMTNGVRCNRPLGPAKTVCLKCQQAVAFELFRTGPGRKLMLELLGQEAVVAEATEMREARQQQLAAKRAALDAERQETARHVVYYARLGANHIKIGTTGDLPRRMVELRVVNASNLLAAEPGGYELERQRHEQFRKWRYNKRKEDFGEGPDLIEHIENVRAIHGEPYQLARQLDKVK